MSLIKRNFLGDVVLDSLNNSSREEDNISDQIYIKQMCSNFLRGFKVLRVIEENAYLKKYSSIKERAHKSGFK